MWWTAPARERYGEAFWRAHHEAWQQSDLNQREYCGAHGLSLKAFGNWRAKFKAEPQPPVRKLLYRRGGLSHTLSHSLSHPLSHVTYPSSWSEGPVVPPARDGHRRRFSAADKHRILEEAAQPSSPTLRDSFTRSNGRGFQHTQVHVAIVSESEKCSFSASLLKSQNRYCAKHILWLC
jgi:hypothetical protein